MEEKYITNSAEETEQLGEEFAKRLKQTAVVYLIGELGSGKTTFTKGVARGLGITTRIISPTFVLLRTHKIMNHESRIKNHGIQILYHLDLYRLESKKEVENIDIKDYLDDKSGVVLIEWPKVSQGLVNKKVWKVKFESLDNDNREISISFES
jgi:tRNA threonylcarbamoyladenosine biosynthesis protein TsaE